MADGAAAGVARTVWWGLRETRGADACAAGAAPRAARGGGGAGPGAGGRDVADPSGGGGSHGGRGSGGERGRGGSREGGHDGAGAGAASGRGDYRAGDHDLAERRLHRDPGDPVGVGGDVSGPVQDLRSPGDRGSFHRRDMLGVFADYRDAGHHLADGLGTGNIAVLGTAPALAGTSGANALVTDAASYAAAAYSSTGQTGTGLYLSLNCAYPPPRRPPRVSLLSGVEGIGTAGGRERAGRPVVH